MASVSVVSAAAPLCLASVLLRARSVIACVGAGGSRACMLAVALLVCLCVGHCMSAGFFDIYVFIGVHPSSTGHPAWHASTLGRLCADSTLLACSVVPL